jgi:endoglucanase
VPIATPLSTSSRWIVDRNGSRVKLAGVNWIGAHEDAMTPGGLNLLNRSAIAEQIAAWGFNSVRFPFAVATITSTTPVAPAGITANPDLAGQTPWEVYQACVAALTGAGLAVIPNCHLLYNGWCCSLQDSNGLWWNSNWPASEFTSTWVQIAQTFAANPLVIGYDVKNEPRQTTVNGTVYNPSWGDGNTLTDFRLMYEQVGNAILKADPSALIICEGINSGGNLTGVAQFPVNLIVPDRVVYSIHDYPQGWPSNESQASYITSQHNSAGYITGAGQSFTAPLWIGEFGLANDSMAALGGSNPVSYGNGLGAGPLSQTYGNWWNNFNAWAGARADLDWCAWHLGGTHVQGTTPSTNQLQYALGDRCWDGIYDQGWGGPANPAALAALQALQAPISGPGVA